MIERVHEVGYMDENGRDWILQQSTEAVMGKIGVWALGLFLIFWGVSHLLTLGIPPWAFGVAAIVAGVAILIPPRP